MSELRERLRDDLKTAMRAKDTLRRDTIRLLEAALKNVEIEQREEADDAVISQTIQKQIRQREESIEQYRAGGRDDLADQEAAEITVLQDYAPQLMDREGVVAAARAAIEAAGATGASDKGKVMGPLMMELRGKADGRLVNEVVSELLDL
jgi:uncharacterized protein YqeY